MRYGNVVLPATGGGIVLVGALGIAYVWILGIITVMLVMIILGFIKLRKGEHDLNYPLK